MRFFQHMGFGESLMISVLGIVIVMAVLIALSFIIRGLSAVVGAVEKRPAGGAALAPRIQTAPMAAAVPAKTGPAPGSAGEVDLYDVDGKTAAMIMAIVADEMQVPLNQLRFIAIRENNPKGGQV